MTNLRLIPLIPFSVYIEKSNILENVQGGPAMSNSSVSMIYLYIYITFIFNYDCFHNPYDSYFGFLLICYSCTILAPLLHTLTYSFLNLTFFFVVLFVYASP